MSGLDGDKTRREDLQGEHQAEGSLIHVLLPSSSSTYKWQMSVECLRAVSPKPCVFNMHSSTCIPCGACTCTPATILAAGLCLQQPGRGSHARVHVLFPGRKGQQCAVFHGHGAPSAVTTRPSAGGGSQKKTNKDQKKQNLRIKKKQIRINKKLNRGFHSKTGRTETSPGINKKQKVTQN